MTLGRSPHPDLYAWIAALPPELGRLLTFHLPLEVQALEVAGASEEIIRARIEQRLPTAFSSGLIDPPFYRWAEGAYKETAIGLLSGTDDIRRRALDSIQPLGAGLAGAAFHGLIRLGYGALRGDEREVARGLAYLRARHQILYTPHDSMGTPTLLLPELSVLRKGTVIEQLSNVAGSPGVLRQEDVSAPLPSVRDLLQKALRLLRQAPSSFVAVHTVTGLHGLAEFHLAMHGAPPTGSASNGLLGSWWRAYSWALQASSVLLESAPEQARARVPQTFLSMDTLVQAAVASCEVHDLKVAVALKRLAWMDLISEDSAIEAGTLKLSATECLP